MQQWWRRAAAVQRKNVECTSGALTYRNGRGDWKKMLSDFFSNRSSVLLALLPGHRRGTTLPQEWRLSKKSTHIVAHFYFLLLLLLVVLVGRTKHLQRCRCTTDHVRRLGPNIKILALSIHTIFSPIFFFCCSSSSLKCIQFL